MVAPERLPAGSEKNRQVQTANGDVDVSRVDGYRILYNNKKKAPFVNVKVELSEAALYAKDTANVIENLKYLNSVSDGMEGKLITLMFNGFTAYA